MRCRVRCRMPPRPPTLSVILHRSSTNTQGTTLRWVMGGLVEGTMEIPPTGGTRGGVRGGGVAGTVTKRGVPIVLLRLMYRPSPFMTHTTTPQTAMSALEPPFDCSPPFAVTVCGGG